MKRILILILTAVLCLTGCANNVPTQPTDGYTAPTLPQFDQSQSPEYHLQSIFDALKGKTFTIHHGADWEKDLNMTPCDTKTLRQLIPNDNLAADFCKKSMMVVPSNDGSFSYQLTDLSVEEACALICARPLTEAEQSTLSGYTDAAADLTISTDTDRVFQELKLTVTLNQTPWTLRITITVQ